MIRRPPRSTRTDTLFPCTTLFRSLLALGIGDRTQFVTFALAARTPIPALAFVGATLGSLAVTIPAALMGEAAWCRLPLGAIRIVCCAVLAVAGLLIGMDAHRLFLFRCLWFAPRPHPHPPPPFCI